MCIVHYFGTWATIWCSSLVLSEDEERIASCLDFFSTDEHKNVDQRFFFRYVRGIHLGTRNSKTLLGIGAYFTSRIPRRLRNCNVIMTLRQYSSDHLHGFVVGARKRRAQSLQIENTVGRNCCTYDVYVVNTKSRFTISKTPHKPPNRCPYSTSNTD